MYHAAIRIPTITASMAYSSLVLLECLVSVVSRRSDRVAAESDRAWVVSVTVAMFTCSVRQWPAAPGDRSPAAAPVRAACSHRRSTRPPVRWACGRGVRAPTAGHAHDRRTTQNPLPCCSSSTSRHERRKRRRSAIAEILPLPRCPKPGDPWKPRDSVDQGPGKCRPRLAWDAGLAERLQADVVGAGVEVCADGLGDLLGAAVRDDRVDQ